MSLINRMLKDLEQRRSSGHDVFAGSAMNQPMGSGSGISRPARIASIALVLCLVLITGLVMRYLWLDQSGTPAADAAAVSADSVAGVDSAATSATAAPVMIPAPGVIDAPGVISAPGEVVVSATPGSMSDGAAAGAVSAATDPVDGAAAPPKSIMRELSLHLYSVRTPTLATAPAASSGSKTSSPRPDRAPASGGDRQQAASSPRRDPSKRVARVEDAADGGWTQSRESRVSGLVRDGREAIKTGQFDRAESRFLAALEMAPDNDTARELLLTLHIEQGRLADAQNVAMEGLSRNHNYTPYRVLLSRVLLEAGRDEQAIVELEAISGQAAMAPDVLLMRAAAYQRVDRHADAVKAYRALVQRQPANGRAWIGMGISLDKQGQSAAARDAFQQALNQRTLSPSLRDFAARRVDALARSAR